MEQIKLGLRIASIVVGIIGYSAIWMWFIRNYRTNEDVKHDFPAWIIFHLILIFIAFFWAWLQEKNYD